MCRYTRVQHALSLALTPLTCEISDLFRQNPIRREQINQRDEQRRGRGCHPATAAAPETSTTCSETTIPSTNSTAVHINPLSPIPTPSFGQRGAAPAASRSAVPPHVVLLRKMPSASVHVEFANPHSTSFSLDKRCQTVVTIREIGRRCSWPIASHFCVCVLLLELPRCHTLAL